jgi:hypothetical protein
MIMEIILDQGMEEMIVLLLFDEKIIGQVLHEVLLSDEKIVEFISLIQQWFDEWIAVFEDIIQFSCDLIRVH